MFFRKILALAVWCASFNSFSQVGWSTIFTPSSGTLWEIEFVNDHVGYVYSSNGEVLRSEDEGWTWEIIYPDNDDWIRSMSFPDEDHGWICGWDGFFKFTEDGGESWDEVNMPDLGSAFLTDYDAVEFYDSLHGWVGFYDEDVTGNYAVYRTSDGGATWENTGSATGGFLYHNFDFLSKDEGWVVLDGQIYSTTDGGDFWNSHITGTGQEYEWVDAVDSDLIFVLTDSGEVWTSTDGSTFTDVADLDWTKHYFEIELLNENFGFVVGTDGELYHYDGSTWNAIVGVTSSWLTGIHIESESSVWLCGSGGTVYRGQITPNDVQEDYFSLQDTACHLNTYPLEITLKNESDYDVNGLYFEVYRNNELYSTLDWTGTIPMDATADIDLGTFEMNGSTSIEVKWYGDTVTYNNSAWEYVEVYEQEPYGTDGEIITCPNEEVTLNAWGGVGYTWLGLDSDGGNLEGESVTVRPQEGNVYVHIDQGNCMVTDSILITYENCQQTTAFSPNSDNINDFFYIENIDGLSCDVTIFNRWGEKVNHISGYNNLDVVWMGDNGGGKSLEAGTYYYVVDFSNGDAQSFSGWVQLLR